MEDAEGTPRSSGMPTKVWAPFFQFQSHEPEFDYLKSTEIEEKINQIKFGPSLGDKLFILSTNGRIYLSFPDCFITYFLIIIILCFS